MRISRFRFRWEGSFRCDNKAPFTVGQVTKKFPNGVMESAIRDFFYDALRMGAIKPQELNC
jgi:hypothetical protein